MSRTGKLEIVVLFPDELRAAALALKQAGEALVKGPDQLDEVEAADKLVATALSLSWSALHHLADPKHAKSHVTLGAPMPKGKVRS